MPAAEGATPTSGTLTDTSGPVTYTAGPFTLANPTPVPVADVGPQCMNPAQPCDEYQLTVSLPSNYAEQHPNDTIRFTAGWTDTGSGQADYDLYVYKGNVTTTNGSQAPYSKSASGSNPEVTSIPVFDGTQTFTVIVVPYTPTAESVNVKIDLVHGASTGGGGGGGGVTFGGPTPTQPSVPRYQILAPPDGSPANGTSGEFNIGFNPKTGNYMTSSSGSVFRVTPPESRTPALPASGPALWTDVSPSIASATSLDPILVTDQSTGRTFVSNFTADPGLLFAFTNDDGATWTQTSVSPPNGGADHQTLGVGPYPSPLNGVNPVYPNALYYCSQGEKPDFCSRSDSGGLQFGPGVPANNGVTGCTHLNGHVRVAPNGTVYLPVKNCGANEGGDVSTDAGNTWTEFNVPNSGTSQSDPSIGIDKNSTAYYCYTPNDGSPHVAVSHDNGTTWTSDVNIGASVGAVQAVFPGAVGGDPGRAACGFLATDKAGDFNSPNFTGRWYLYIATTYDGGKTWTTVNATPNDPVQGAGGLCLAGTLACGANRNLLDFNEITLDKQGRVAYGYDDGCVTQTCIGSGGAKNDYVAYQRIARQTGGKSLYAAYDTVEPAAPQQPYLSGTRDNSRAVLSWNAPDNGGSDITSYDILRGTTPGSESKIATVLGSKTTYEDASVSSAVATYYYKVVPTNGQGTGPASNEAALQVTAVAPPANPCKAPGATILTDASGDSLTGVSGTDLKALEVSQPYRSDGSLKLRFQLDTDPGMNPEAPGSYWYVSFKNPDGSVHAVRMWFDPSNPTVPTFQSYVAAPNTSGTTDGRFVKSGTAKPADASSSYNPTTGTIVIVASAADLGLAPGDTIAGFNAASVQPVSTPAGGIAETVDQMPDSLGYQGSFSVQSNDACFPDTPPTASLSATPSSGEVPLTVSFDGSASSDPDTGDSPVSYTFDFGDGSPTVTQASPTIQHTYVTEGEYVATLTVKDTHGKQSLNAASQRIGVEPSVKKFEDNATQIAYPKGWHTVPDADASGGHFRLGVGKGLSFTFDTTTANGKVAYAYGTSTKGGTADLFLDGTKIGTLNFKGGSGSESAPVFGSSISANVAAGTHTLTLENVNGPINVDGITVTDGGSDSQPTTGPGETTASTGSVKKGATSTSTEFVPTSATALAVFVESSTPVKFQVTIVSPSGKTIAQATSKNGIVSLTPAVSKYGNYKVKVTNLGSGKLGFFSAVTPYVNVG